MLKNPKLGRGQVSEVKCREVCHALQSDLSHSPAGLGRKRCSHTSKATQGPFHASPQRSHCSRPPARGVARALGG